MSKGACIWLGRILKPEELASNYVLSHLEPGQAITLLLPAALWWKEVLQNSQTGNSRAVQRPGEGHRWIPHFCLTSLESQALVTDAPLVSKPGGTELEGTDPEQVPPAQRQESFARLRLSGRGQPCSIAPLYVVAQFLKSG